MHISWSNNLVRVCSTPTTGGNGCRTEYLGRLCMHAVQRAFYIHACVHSWHFAAQVFEVSFWLMKYGAGSAKRLLLRGNWPWLGQLDLGKLPREERLRKTTIKTSRLLLSFNTHACTHTHMHACILAWRSNRIKVEWHKAIERHTVSALYKSW